MRTTVGEAVRKRLVADVPLGALLSGGIDSSVVVALMAQASAEPVRTFTVGFSDARYDERAHARVVAERYGTVHEELEIDEDVAATLPRLAAAYDEPLGDEAAFPTFLIAEQARRHVTVALAGDGGDEAFAGYERYIAHGLAERIPGPAAHAGAAALRLLPAARREPRSTLFRAARFLDVAAASSRRALRAADGGLPARAAAIALGRRPRGTPSSSHRSATASRRSSCSTSRRTSPATCC